MPLKINSILGNGRFQRLGKHPFKPSFSGLAILFTAPAKYNNTVVKQLVSLNEFIVALG